MSVNIVVLIGIITSLCGVIFGYLAYNWRSKTDSKSEGKKDGELKADTEYIKRRIDDVLLEQKDTNKTLGVHADRLARVEESVKSAHHRLDDFKKGLE